MSNNEKAARLTRRRRRHGSIYIPLAIILTVVLLIVGVIIFFKVAVIEVEGTDKYTATEVIEASGIKKGQNIFRLDKDSVEQKIYEQLPYIDEVTIVRKLPEKVLVEVSECYHLAAIRSGGDYLIINKHGKILEESNSADDSILVRGVKPVEPEVGKKLALGDTGAMQLNAMTDVLSAFVAADMADEIEWLDMSNIGNITFEYQDRFTVELGKSENAEMKMQLLLSVVENLQGTDKGRIDVSTENEVHFIPD